MSNFPEIFFFLLKHMKYINTTVNTFTFLKMSMNSNLSPFIHSDSERSCNNTESVYNMQQTRFSI